MVFEIKKGIKIPSFGTKMSEYPFDDMDIGDCFDLDDKFRKTAACAASRYGKRHGKRFIIRRLDENAHRCWRIK